MKAKPILTALAVCGLALVSETFSFADEFNRKIVFTFSQPVAIPPVHQPGWGVLPAGTYVFKIANSTNDRHIVQIFNKDETEIYATVLAIPDVRVQVTGDVVITFRETPAGQPPAIRAMFYPGRTYGEEFVYPKARATELAQATKMPVLSMPVAEEVSKPEAPGVIEELEKTQVTAVEPTGVEVQTAEVVTPPTPAELKKEEAPAKLPRTASAIPLIGLMGLLALGAAFALRLGEKRIR